MYYWNQGLTTEDITPAIYPRIPSLLHSLGFCAPPSSRPAHVGALDVVAIRVGTSAKATNDVYTHSPVRIVYLPRLLVTLFVFVPYRPMLGYFLWHMIFYVWRQNRGDCAFNLGRGRGAVCCISSVRHLQHITQTDQNTCATE